MKKGIKIISFIIILPILVVAIAGFIKFNIIGDDLYIEHVDGSIVKINDLDEYVFNIENGNIGIFSYTSKDKDTATLQLDRSFYQLMVERSASGTKYTNEDGSVVYWEHQGEAMINIFNEKHVASNIESAEILIFNVEPYKKDCVGVAPMKCFVINGEFFYDSIEGFNFKDGTEYQIRVARTERKNIPADASRYIYRLIEIL